MEIVDEFSHLDSNHSKEVKALEKKIDKHLEETGDNDVHLLDIKRMLEAYKIPVKVPNAFEEACEIVSPLIERLLKTNVNKFLLIDIKIGQTALALTKDFKESDILAEKFLVALDNFKSSKAYQNKLSIYLNMTERMIVADRAIEDYELSLEIEGLFYKYLNRGFSLCSEIGGKLKPYEILLKIKEAIYPKEVEGFKKAEELLEEFKELVPKEFYKGVKDSTSLHSVGENFNMTRNQFNYLCGKRMREVREAKDISPKKLAQDLGGDMSAEKVNLLETGRSPFDAYILCKVADRLGITVREFLKGITEDELDNEEDEIIARLKKTAKGLDKKIINSFIGTLETLKETKGTEKSEKRKSLRAMYKYGEDE